MKITEIDDRRPINRTITTLGFWLAGAISLVIAAVILLSIARLIQDYDWVAHTYVVLTRLDNVATSLNGVESTQRGYLITGTARYLDLYHTAATTLTQRINDVRPFVQDNPAEQQRLDSLMPLVTTRLNYLEQGITLRRQQGFDAAQSYVFSDDGARTLTDIRTVIRAMQDEENGLLQQRIDGSRSSALAAIIAFASGAVVSFALIVGTFYRLNGEVASRVKAQQTLEKERNLLRTLMESLPDSVFVKDTESRILTNNHTHRVILGKGTVEEVVGKTDFDLFSHELAEQYYADEQALIRTGQPVINREEPTMTAAGVARWHLTTKVPLRDSQGEVTGLVGISRDITERKHSEEILRYHASLTQSVPDAVISTDLNLNILTWNKAAEDLYGWSAEEVVGKEAMSILQPENIPQPIEPNTQEFLRAGFWRGETLQTTKAGKIINVLVSSSTMKDSKGNAVGVITVNRDITERKRADAQIAYQANLLENVNDAILATDEQFRVTYWNHAAEIIYGWKASEALGQPSPDLLRTKLDDGERQRIVHALVEKGLANAETIQLRKDGKPLHIDGTSMALHGADGQITGYVTVNRDITERRRADAAIRALNADLQQRATALEASNKELEAFSYSISHDLRAPLRAIDGFSRILLEEHGPQLDAEAGRYLQRVRENAQRMGQLIDDLLAFSRLSRQPLKTQSVPLADLVRQTANELRGEQAERPIELVIGDLPDCEADPALLKQVLANLISNAIKYTRGREPARIEIGCENLNGERTYFVKDNGAGFDSQYAGKMFGVFQRLHSAKEYEGTGVGLAIVQRIVHRHNGRIWAVGEVDKGATLYFTLGANNHG